MHVPTRAGDLCFFDSRLLHASAAPSRDNIRRVGRDRLQHDAYFWPQISSHHTKYVLYWDSCNTAMSADFLRNSMQRSQTEPAGMIEKPLAPAVWTRILALSYPYDFPPGFVAAAESQRIVIASLGPADASLYKRKLDNMQLSHPWRIGAHAS
jgi:hypothetical protein